MIQSEVEPISGHRLITEKIDAVYDWQDFLKGVNFTVSGLIATKNEPEVCHAWRCVLREDVPTYRRIDHDDWAIETPAVDGARTTPLCRIEGGGAVRRAAGPRRGTMAGQQGPDR